MTAVSWDEIGDRFYEDGIDRAVFYRGPTASGAGVAWNGLTSFTENTNNEVTPVVFDGRKINDIVTYGDFSGTLTAITYPDTLIPYQGFGNLRPGLDMGQQPVRRIGLCYRTFVGNDVSPDVGYKLHLLYNATLTPSEFSRTTRSDTPELTEFSWEVTAIPIDIVGFRSSPYFIIDSRFLDPTVLTNLETMLYGSVSADPRLPTEAELTALVVPDD
jgi:hypothetical protein